MKKTFVVDGSMERMDAMSVINLLPSTDDEMVTFVNKIRKEITASSHPEEDIFKLAYALKTIHAIINDEEINNFINKLCK
jgi:hypothetical protein